MKETVVVDLGIIPYEMVKDYIEKSPYEVIFIGKEMWLKSLRNLRLPNKIVSYEEMLVPVSNHAKCDSFDKIYNGIVNDYRTQLIAERVSIRYGYRSNHNDLATIELMIENYLLLLTGYDIKFVFYMACPHALNSWVFSNVAEHLGIKVYLTFNSLFYWRNIIMEGVKNEKLIVIDNKDIRDSLADKYIEAVNKKYEDAIPEYEKQRLSKRKKSLFSWREELKAGFRKPKTLFFRPLKYNLYKNFVQHCKMPDLNEKYIILFMHYQPERTSLPEGRMYTNQIHIVNSLHRALPKGWKLYVKEHPATFTNSADYDPRYRDLSFYEYISQLPDVTLVDLSVDSFSLIDNCQCLATITGTVGGEGLLRGKPVLVFGNAPYRGHKYVYDINSIEDIRIALNEISNITKDEVREETYNNFIPYIIKNSISGIDTNNMTLDKVYSEEIRNRGIGRCLGLLLSDKI